MSEFHIDPIVIKNDGSTSRVGLFLLRWSQLSAIGGITILLGICLLSTVSVLGRWVFDSPITGDVELVQVGCALALASFLPYAQMKNAHVIVDFFTLNAPINFRRFLDVFAALLMAAAALMLAWRSTVGAISTYKSSAATMILNLPEWLAHLTIAPGFVLLSLTALYTAWVQFNKQENKLKLSDVQGVHHE